MQYIFMTNEITLQQVSASKPEKATFCKNMKTCCSASEIQQMRRIKILLVSIVQESVSFQT